MATRREQLHASCIAVDGRGALILGASGSGKSSLCASLIALGAKLVADDQVIIEAQGDGLIATCPAPIQGLLELYPFGVVKTGQTEGEIPLVAAYECVLNINEIERSPEIKTHTYCGVDLSVWQVSASYAPLPAQIMLHIRGFGRV